LCDLTAEACLRHGSDFSHSPIEFHRYKNDAIARWKLSAPQRNQLKPVKPWKAHNTKSR